eukprot:CAMPEP_0183335860 /NCGR_PEP_ID=MMETSP0164_2-20130417/4020_1 /TAXON_ID=221442 /ORGANISM="Coccolithus pelagicus ssp braarudi, Strain PLY182g" /LENGTH=104 /DNA_ID=CAMNT_0025505289 /DNA_START=478 /DNA_END=793 /DNA_ORIENTATION=-
MGAVPRDDVDGAAAAAETRIGPVGKVDNSADVGSVLVMPQQPDFLSMRMLVTVHSSAQQQRGERQQRGHVSPSQSTASPGTSACPSLRAAGVAATGSTSFAIAA